MYDLPMIEFFSSNSEIITRLLVAVALGLIVGTERILVRKSAGMKTHAMVSLGSALFIIISEMIAIKYQVIGGFDPTRIASQIIVGVGFLGAGSIMFQGNRLHGLTTAGGLWVTAGIGMAAGFGLYSLAIITTLLVLFVFVVISMMEKPIREYTDTLPEEEK